MTGALHDPVLLAEVIDALDPQPGDVIVDATFGAGGYSRALLDAGAIVHAFDRDPEPIMAARAWPETREDPPRLVLHPHCFSDMAKQLGQAGIARVDGITMDVGVSSMQLDQAERGFSFNRDGPLDMRMSQSGESAADFLNSADQDQIADVLFQFGEERQSRRVARAIIAARPLATTGDLARTVRTALGYRAGATKDPATRSFQAIRIHVNAELDELASGLRAAETLLRPRGRLAVVSFHSLEDRIVKRFLKEASASPAGSRHLPQVEKSTPIFCDVSKPVRSSAAEIARNPRARSAILRHAVRTSAPARAAA